MEDEAPRRRTRASGFSPGGPRQLDDAPRRSRRNTSAAASTQSLTSSSTSTSTSTTTSTTTATNTTTPKKAAGKKRKRPAKATPTPILEAIDNNVGVSPSTPRRNRSDLDLDAKRQRTQASSPALQVDVTSNLPPLRRQGSPNLVVAATVADDAADSSGLLSGTTALDASLVDLSGTKAVEVSVASPIETPAVTGTELVLTSIESPIDVAAAADADLALPSIESPDAAEASAESQLAIRELTGAELIAQQEFENRYRGSLARLTRPKRKFKAPSQCGSDEELEAMAFIQDARSPPRKFAKAKFEERKRYLEIGGVDESVAGMMLVKRSNVLTADNVSKEVS